MYKPSRAPSATPDPGLTERARLPVLPYPARSSTKGSTIHARDRSPRHMRRHIIWHIDGCCT